MPLQRSLFRDIDRAAEAVGCADVLPGGRLGAWLDERGDLHLDGVRAAVLTAALRDRMTPKVAADLEARHRSATARLLGATRTSASAAASATEPMVKELLAELCAAVRDVLSLAILARFVPDALMHGLREAEGEGSIPFPQPSAGAGLVNDVLDLWLRCSALGYSTERLAESWPNVDGRVSSEIRAFCRDHAGFGPLAWDAPGYEDPGYVVRAMHASVGGQEVTVVRERLRSSLPGDPEGRRPAEAQRSALRSLLGWWLDFLERETWFVRHAFFVGMAPLLRRLSEQLAGQGAAAAPDLLFLDVDEILGGPKDARTLAVARRATYLADRTYLEARGIDPGRLEGMMAQP